MNRLLKRVIRDLVKFIATFNNELPAILEQDMANIQGKGVGVESVNSEVRSALRFFAPPHENNATDPLSIKSKLIVFDVGANIGSYTNEVLIQYPNCLVFAFEPSILAGSIFLERHKLEANVHFEAFGFYSEITSKILYSDTPGSPIASLTRRNLQHFGNEFKCQEKVKLDTIDNYCQINGVIPDLLKIDVEGHELDVLMGALDTINKIAVVQFEFGGCNIDSRTFFQNFWYFFKQNDFKIYRITNNKPLLIDKYSESDEYFSTTNYLAVNNRIS